MICWDCMPSLTMRPSRWSAWMKRANSCWSKPGGRCRRVRARSPKKITNIGGPGHGTCSSPWSRKAGHREVAVTPRRTKRDFVAFVQRSGTGVYAGAHTIHLVMDNLNTHFRASFEEIMGVEEATGFWRECDSTTRPNTPVG